MKRFASYAGSGLVAVMVAGWLAGTAQMQTRKPLTTEADFNRATTELSNWGRWGKDDQLGAANLITPARRKQALALAKTGETVSLSHNPLMEKAVDAPDPFDHSVSIIGQAGIAVEKQEFSFHGSTFTHLH